MKKKKAFAWSPIRKLMKRQGANIVERDAVAELIMDLERIAAELTNKALSLAKHANKKKVTLDDIKLAMELL